MINDSLRPYVEKITNLPSLPVIAQEIIALADNDLISINKLEMIIENDPAISAKILSVSNSVFYGFHTPVTTLHNAIMRIGFSSVKNIALGISIMTVLNDIKHQGTPHYERVFNHSVSVGLTARLLSKRLKCNITDEIVISGILHDIGLLVLIRYFPERYMEVMDSFKQGVTLSDAEKETFGFSHADIGYWLAGKWNLPDTVTDSILNHHSPSLTGKNLEHIAAVHIADYIVDNHVIRATAQDFISRIDTSTLTLLDMSEDDLNIIVTEVKGGSFFNDLFTA